MNEVELRERLHVDAVSPRELRVVLEAYFQMARYPRGDVIEYLKGDQLALSVGYRKGRLSSLAAGPVLAAEDIAAIEARLVGDVLADRGQAVRREITFADVPVTGAWRYDDRFQIVPAPENAPRPPQLLADASTLGGPSVRTRSRLR